MAIQDQSPPPEKAQKSILWAAIRAVLAGAYCLTWLVLWGAHNPSGGVNYGNGVGLATIWLFLVSLSVAVFMVFRRFRNLRSALKITTIAFVVVSCMLPPLYVGILIVIGFFWGIHKLARAFS